MEDRISTMSTRRASAHRKCGSSVAMANDLVDAVYSFPSKFLATQEEIVPLEFGVVEVKSEVEEIVVTSQFRELTSLMETSFDEENGLTDEKPSPSTSLVEIDSPSTIELISPGSSLNHPYSCTMCAKQFGRQAALKKHLESHKVQSREKPRRGRESYPKAEALQKTFAVQELVKHDNSISNKLHVDSARPKHVSAVRSAQSKLHICPTCGKTFGSRSHLEEHVRTHTGEKPFRCPTCSRGFASPSNLKKHVRFHKRHMPFVCSFCLQSYYTNDLLTAHIEVHKGYFCPECKEVLANRDDLEQHRYNKHGVRNDFRCTSCEADFEQRAELLAHHLTHVQPDVFLCNKCKTGYRYPSELRLHMASHVNKITPGVEEPVNICLSQDVIENLVKSKQAKANPRQPVEETRPEMGSSEDVAGDDRMANCGAMTVLAATPKFEANNNGNKFQGEKNLPSCSENNNSAQERANEVICNVCQANFESAATLMTHKVMAHETTVLDSRQFTSGSNRSKFVCLYCNKSFSKRYCLEQHERVHSGERPFSCETCGVTFKQQSQLAKHTAKHTGIKPYVCQFCKKAFAQASYLTEHKRQHTNERPYHCETCGNRFRTNGALRVHRRLHTGAMPYECEVCSRRFKQKANLLKHVQIHTNVRSHNCPECDKGFTDSQALKRHMVMHTGDRPYVCSMCGKTFPAQSSLTIHMKFHRGERAHKCDLCGKAFVVKSHLNRHLQTHVKKDVGVIFGQEQITDNYIPIDDELVISDSFQVEEVVLTS